MASKAKRRVFLSGQTIDGYYQPNYPTFTQDTIRLDARVDHRRVMRYCCPSSTMDGKDITTSQIEGFSTQELPVFGNLQAYGIEQAHQRRLWELEVERLIEVTSNGATEALCPDSIVTEDDLLKSPAQSQSFETLRSLADNILYSLHICILDDFSLPALDDQNWAATDRARESYNALRQLTGEEAILPGRRPRAPRGHDDDDDYAMERIFVSPRSKTKETQREQSSHLHGNMLEQYHYLVDQITATLAHLAIQGRDNDYWQVVVLACLAKVSTKLKILTHDLFKNIKESVKGKGASFRLELTDMYETNAGGAKDKYRDDEKDQDVQLVVGDNSPRAQGYTTECLAITHWLTDCFMEVLLGLGAQKPWWTESGDFDIGVLIYASGMSGTRTLLAQDRRGAFSGTSEVHRLSWASNAMELVKVMSACLPLTTQNSMSLSPPEVPNNAAPFASLNMDFESPVDAIFPDQTKEVHLHTILDFVVISIPLSLSNPKLGGGFERGLQAISALSAFNRPNKPRHSFNFYGFISLKSFRSRSIHSARSKEVEPRNGKIASSLSTSFMTEIRHHPLDRSAPDRLSSFKARTISAEARKKRDKLQNTTRLWMIKEDAITIDCHAYVSITFLSVAILVLGGLSCGFTLGERLPGVDPFNLTMFSWIIGGFILLVAKNTRVSNWTWRDFLLRRATCRTVKEVADVTGLEEQDVLVFLLSSEMYSPLNTSGPFQAAFSKCPVDNAFSIDVKPDLQTLLGSGIVPITVQTLAGPALVFLRLIPGSSGLKSVKGTGTLRQKGYRGRGSGLASNVCIDPPHQNEDRDVVLIDKPIEWVQVLGMYNSTQAGFR